MARSPASALPQDTRNDFSGRRDLPFRLFVAAVILSGGALLVDALRVVDLALLRSLDPAFWALCALLIVAELRPLFTAGARDPNGHVLTTSFVFAVLVRYGFPVAILIQAVATTVSDVSHRKAPWRTAFNIGQYGLSWGAASLAMGLLGSSPDPYAPVDMVVTDLAVTGVGALVYFAVNQLLVSVAVGLKIGKPWWQLLREDLAYEGLSNGALLALSPLIVLTCEEGPFFLPLLLPPLLAVYTVGAIALEREQQSLTDALTGLPNRKLLARRTDEALEAPEGDRAAALLLFDLDRFKEVNDTLGHHVGDQLLEVVGRRLTAAVRPGDTVARLGGDEFAVLLPGTDAATAERTARRLLEEIDAPIHLEGLPVDVRASVGVAVAPEHGTALDELLQHADVAMYLAKETGNGVEQYDAERDRNTTQRLVMVGELRKALAEGAIEVHYQPKASLGTGQVTGVEALVRWRHPERGLVPPDEFIPLAESSGLIELLTQYVLDVALQQVAAWRRQGLPLKAAVNVSVRDLSGLVLVDNVVAALGRSGLPASCLLLEVTEGSLFAESHRAGATLRRLEELGVALSLDDFGTGFSSLDHLRRLPVQELKVDRSFVSRMHGDVRDTAIVRSVVDLGIGLGMRIVAEGVEDQETWNQLQQLGCDEAQGWLLSRAEPAATLTPWLLARRAAVPAQIPRTR